MPEARTVSLAEFDAWVEQLGTGFHFEVAEGFPGYLTGFVDLDRTWGSFDGHRMVGTLRSFPTELTVPGGRQVKAAALTNVTVAPTHRRQGRLTDMIVPELRASVDRGEPISILISSEYPIYGRFGYGPAIESASYTVFTREAAFRELPSGSVELADRATLRREGPEIFDRARRQQPGLIKRPAHWWDRALGLVDVPGAEPVKGRIALHRSSDGELDGFVRYEGVQEWDVMRPNGLLRLEDLVAASPAAYHALWSYCCGIDLLRRIEARLRPVDEVLPFLLRDGRAVQQTSRADFLWARVLDVDAALAARTYATPGDVVLEVVDALGFATGCHRLVGGPDGATCEPTTQRPSVTVPVDALASAYLGGVGVRTLALAGRVVEHHPGAVDLLDAMFRSSVAPWCNTWF